MPKEPGRNVRSSTRRAVLKAGLGLAGLGAGVAATPLGALAQDQAWYDTIFGKGNSASVRNTSVERPSAREVDLRDLREGKTPWLSDVMLQRIDEAIERYRQIVSSGGWPQVPGPRMMRPNDDDERVPALRRRLLISGELARNSTYYESYGFDSELEAAVVRFQSRHGLKPTGRVDRPTFAALNVTAEMRLDQLRLNRRRIEELLRGRVDNRYVLVNIPAFQLEAVESFEVHQRHRVIAGRTERQTPEIRATIRALNFFPYWHVPDSVARLDLVPRMQKDPEYLAREHIRAYRGGDYNQEIALETIDWYNVDINHVKFRQDPGPWNALGLVRIDMPNADIVYMHDTPMKQLFGQASRGYSAGCVRVQNVFDLVDWLARYEVGWENPGQAQAVVDAGMPLDVSLTRPVPVVFAYITAWGEPGGIAQFRPDLYNRDGSRAFAVEADPEDLPPVGNDLAP
ncbi:MAG: L,D-transpeptidase family protein [Hyphomicrobiaceae bacterium]|nr:L,D-transpeptidase family protein [Hyphomicrobiaceae bacterium]